MQFLFLKKQTPNYSAIENKLFYRIPLFLEEWVLGFWVIFFPKPFFLESFFEQFFFSKIVFSREFFQQQGNMSICTLATLSIKQYNGNIRENTCGPQTLASSRAG